ncbi:hypothetical protein JMU72_14410, partial [Mammaliicoccus sciuri]|nr:hypothetical protein [Mammaliicoccus sciuri]
QTESIGLKLGDRIEQVATYINAQQSIVNASVTENNELQFFASTMKAPEGVVLEGSLADELDVSAGQLVTMDDIDMSTAGKAQLS